MKFHFENLGLLDRVDLELADLTLICGENNTGKTYATYAVYGFLRSWRQILRSILRGTLEDIIQDSREYRLDLNEMFGSKINEYLAAMGKQYLGGLPRAFAAESTAFSNTSFVPMTTRSLDFTPKAYQQTVQAGPNGRVIATLQKAPGSNLLEILVGIKEPLLRLGGFSGFVADAIADIVFAPHLPQVHIASAERTGAAIFRKELDMARTRVIKAINEIDSKELKRNPLQILKEIDSGTGYAWPVEDNVDFVRQLEDLDKQVGELAREHPELLQSFDEIIGGTYKVVKQQLVFQSKGGSRQRFTMNEASSCIRALLDIGFYLRCKAKPGELFIIDEPELNLHPKSQRAFARLVSRMIHAGLKVFITTHSDYLVKELNTLIMLNQRTEHTRKVQHHHRYDDAELLDPNRVKLYMTAVLSDRRKKTRTLKLATIYPDRGIAVETFDDTIETMNNIQSEIMYGGDA